MQETTNQQISSALISDLLKEKRADRRWRNIRFILWFALIAYITLAMLSHFSSSLPTTGLGGKYVSLIRLDGMIAPGNDFSSSELVPILHDAFSDKNAAGVVLDINSPGGTPVQAAIIHDAILAYKKEYHKKVIIVGEDMLTSGAYYVAVAGDQIYVNPNTITGSIGVIVKSFGFTDIIKKLGVTRRVYTAGTNKDRLDPFLPETPEDIQKIKSVIAEVHKNFEQAVLAGRKGKLRGDPSKLFTGDFWSGETALTLGLVDHLGNLMDATKKEFDTTEYKEYGGSNNIFRLLSGQLSSAFDSMLYWA